MSKKMKSQPAGKHTSVEDVIRRILKEETDRPQDQDGGETSVVDIGTDIKDELEDVDDIGGPEADDTNSYDDYDIDEEEGAKDKDGERDADKSDGEEDPVLQGSSVVEEDESDDDEDVEDDDVMVYGDDDSDDEDKEEVAEDDDEEKDDDDKEVVEESDGEEEIVKQGTSDVEEGLDDDNEKSRKDMSDDVSEEVEISDDEMEEDDDDSVDKDIDAVFDKDKFSEAFRTKAKGIFEAALKARVKKAIKKLNERATAAVKKRINENEKKTSKNVDKYVSYVAEEWVKKNELAIERGLRAELAEHFISGLKDLFESHYVDVPNEKYDVLAEMDKKIEDLTSKLNESKKANVMLATEVVKASKASIVSKVARGLSDVQQDKLVGVAEHLSFNDTKSFTKQLEDLKENYFGSKKKSRPASAIAAADDSNGLLEEDVKINQVGGVMRDYAKMLDSTLR